MWKLTMIDVKQLELNLELTFETAAYTPEEANLSDLWLTFERVMGLLPHQEQLRIGGLVIDQLAEIYQSKANYLLDDWEEAHNEAGPNFPDEWLQGFVRQSQTVDVSDVVRQPTRRPKQLSMDLLSEVDSLAEEVEKTAVLAMVDELEAEAQKAKALAVAHDENVSAWVEMISSWFATHPQSLPLVELWRQLDMPLVQLWLGLLLGGFGIEQRGDFYEVEQVWVEPTSKIAC